MPGIDFDAIRNDISIEEVLNLLGFSPVSQSGDQWRGPCPVHRSSLEQSRSFSVNIRLNRYFCHSCGSKGHHLELWAAVHQLTIYDAAQDLCRALHRDVPWLADQ